MVNHESRMLIDCKPVESEAGWQFDNIKPATEKILGSAGDTTRADMERAIAAARHAFDDGPKIFAETKTVGWPS